jgi:hypothetical protein
MLVIALALLAVSACTSKAMLVARRTDAPGITTARRDVPSIAWYSHSKDTAGIRVVTLLSPNDQIPPESVVVRKSLRSLTLCYSVVPASSSSSPGGLIPTMLRFRVPGIRRMDKRRVEVSRTCGREV